MENTEIDKFLTDQTDHLDKLHKIVKDTIAEEELIVNNLLHPPKEILTPGLFIPVMVTHHSGDEDPPLREISSCKSF